MLIYADHGEGKKRKEKSFLGLNEKSTKMVQFDTVKWTESA